MSAAEVVGAISALLGCAGSGVMATRVLLASKKHTFLDIYQHTIGFVAIGECLRCMVTILADFSAMYGTGTPSQKEFLCLTTGLIEQFFSCVVDLFMLLLSIYLFCDAFLLWKPKGIGHMIIVMSILVASLVLALLPLMPSRSTVLTDDLVAHLFGLYYLMENGTQYCWSDVLYTPFPLDVISVVVSFVLALVSFMYCTWGPIKHIVGKLWKRLTKQKEPEVESIPENETPLITDDFIISGSVISEEEPLIDYQLEREKENMLDEYIEEYVFVRRDSDALVGNGYADFPARQLYSTQTKGSLRQNPFMFHLLVLVWALFCAPSIQVFYYELGANTLDVPKYLVVLQALSYTNGFVMYFLYKFITSDKMNEYVETYAPTFGLKKREFMREDPTTAPIISPTKMSSTSPVRINRSVTPENESDSTGTTPIFQFR